jgi:hypothetical protein
MGYSVKQSSTTVPILFGPVVLSSDNLSAATGKTLTVTISKNGGSFASPSGSVSEVGNGYYEIAANSTDNGTLGPLIVNATGSGCDTFSDTFAVVTFDPFSTTNGLISSGTGTAQLSTSSGQVVLQSGTGTGQISLNSGQVQVQSGTGSGQIAITSGQVQVQSGTGNGQIDLVAGIPGGLRTATAAGGSSSTITLDGAANSNNGFYNDALVSIIGGTGASQVRLITSYVGSTQVASVTPNWVTNPDISSVYVILPQGRSDVGAWLGTVPGSPAAAGIPDVNAKNINNVSTSSVTAVNSNVGTNQPINFTGTGGSALVQTDVTDWKASTAPAMTGDAYARLGAPAGASVSSDVAAIKSDTGTVLTDVNTGAGAIYSRLGAPAGASIAADIAAVKTDTVHLPNECLSSSIPSGTPAAGSFIGNTGLSSTDNFYQGCMLVFTSGANKGIARAISSYTGSSKTFSFTGATDAIDAPFPTAPSTSDTFDILGRAANGT